MKKLQKIIILSVVLISGVALFAVAFADGDPGFKGRGFGKHHGNRGLGLALLTKYQVKNLAAQTLSEMSGQPVKEITQKFEKERPRAVMQELNINRETFRAAMQEKVKGLVKQAEENGSITLEQKNNILAKIEEKAQRRTLMKQLIDKGVADGTITEEQALMLQHKPR